MCVHNNASRKENPTYFASLFVILLDIGEVGITSCHPVLFSVHMQYAQLRI